MNAIDPFAETCAALATRLAVALPCPPDPRFMGGLMLALVLLGPLTVVVFVLWNRPAASHRSDAHLTADRIMRLKARIVEARAPDVMPADRANVRLGDNFDRSPANLPFRPAPQVSRAAADCRWRYLGWRPGTRLARWNCSTCGAESSSLHERHPPVHCRNASLP